MSNIVIVIKLRVGWQGRDGKRFSYHLIGYLNFYGDYWMKPMTGITITKKVIFVWKMDRVSHLK
jgi:hypothetical protein